MKKLCLSLFLISILPKDLDIPRVLVFEEPLSITVDRQSPPLAALEDVNLNSEDPIYQAIWKFPKESTYLAAGQKVQFPKEEKKVVAEPIVLEPLQVVPVAVKKNRWEINKTNLSKHMRLRMEKEKEWSESLENYKRPMTMQEKAKYLLALDQEEQKKSPSAILVQSVTAEVAKVDSEISETVNQKTDPTTEEEGSNSYAVSGEVEISGGLAYMGNQDVISVYREDEGFLQEQGKVWIRDGKYEIYVENKVGYLVSELRDQSGRLKGRGKVFLSNIKASNKNNKIENVKLKIEPLQTAASSKVLSAYSFSGFEKKVSGATVETSFGQEETPLSEEGTFQSEALAEGSTFQIRTKAANHWGTTIIGHAGHEYQLKLFSDKMIDAFFDLTKNSVDKTYGIVWGRVQAGGSNVEGVKVELAGEDLRPIYFNSLMIPDKSLRSTTNNGLFAFVGVLPGIHQIRAFHKKIFLPPQVIAAEEGHLTYVKVTDAKSRPVLVRVYDAIDTAKPLSAVLRVVGQDDLTEIGSDGMGSVDVPQDHALMFLEASSFDDYETVRLIRPRDVYYIHVPSIETLWLEGLFAQAEIEHEKENGVIVGFVSGSDLDIYETFLGQNVEDHEYQTIYFDEQGRLSEGPVNGGGFVMANVQAGLQTVVIAGNEPLPLASHLVIADPGIVSVIQQIY